MADKARDNQPPHEASGTPGSRLTRREAVGMDLLGVDWGARRIGVALKPPGQDWAVPHAVLEVRDEIRGRRALREVIVVWQSNVENRNSPAACLQPPVSKGVVVGLPLHPGGVQAARIKRWCRKVRQGLKGVRWFFVDERLTSQAADSISHWRSSRRPTDDLAAVLILETFIQSCP